MPHRNNVLRVNTVEEQTAYRNAVAEILRVVQADHTTTLLEISERIGVSLGTISNAANKKCDLNALYLKRIGEAYGPHHLSPYAALAGGRVVARDPESTTDILPTLTMATHHIAMARAPHSEGGVAETLREQLGYLPELRRLYRELGALICQIEARKEAA